MTDRLDIDTLKAKLREYDPELPRCPKKIERIETFIYDFIVERDDKVPRKSYHPCCRPEGHEGRCSNTRSVLGWPGYEVLKALIESYERSHRAP